jgi:DNA-binding NtrC family response regulator
MMPVVLLAIHDQARRGALRDAAAGEGYRVHGAGSLAEARRVLARCHIDVAVVDEVLDPTGVLVLELRRWQTTPRTRVVRLFAPERPAAATAPSWRPDASLGSSVPPASVIALLTMLAPIVRTLPSA